jgi:ATPase subunit of ABC transporter with duplicated ATPase domains
MSRLIAVNNISMHFGARILYEDVTATFLALAATPSPARTAMLTNILTGELDPSKASVTRPKKIGVRRQDQFAFDPYRVLDTVVMGNPALCYRVRSLLLATWQNLRTA